MITFKRILCPVDFSETSDHALTYAIAFATSYESQLTVLHVVPTFNEPLAVDESSQTPHPGSHDQVIARLRRTLEHAGAGTLNAQLLAQEGHAADTIVNCGTAMKADLLVMGTHGLGGFRRLLLGSVTEKVVRTATCPLLTVPPAVPATTRRSLLFRKILCPIDFSSASLKALDYALELGRQGNGRVTVLHALEYMDPEEPPELPEFDPCREAVMEHRQRRDYILKHARQQLDAQLAGESRTWCEIDEVVTVNRAYKEILQRAAAAEADLIVMGAQGGGSLEVMLHGSHTNHVVRAATCPVLTIRA